MNKAPFKVEFLSEDVMNKKFSEDQYVELKLSEFVGSVVPFLGFLQESVKHMSQKDLEDTIVRVFKKSGDGHIRLSIGFPC